MGLKEAAILGRKGFQSELHLEVRPVLFIGGFLFCMAAYSVRSRCERELRDFSVWMSFQAISCPVVREW